MKAARHAMILDLIETFNIETQDDLAMRLKDRGINVTQATVSRDIKELRLIKVLAEDGGYKYATVDKAEAGLKERFIRIFLIQSYRLQAHPTSSSSRRSPVPETLLQRPSIRCGGMRLQVHSQAIIRFLLRSRT